MASKIISDAGEKIIMNSFVTHFMRGAGIAYCVSEEKYLHIPLVIIFPGTYTGYQMYNNRNIIIRQIFIDGLRNSSL